MNNEPLVSIIINCFNGEKYVKDAINSVLKQSYTKWELIFWDNHSTDSTASIVKNFKDVRIKYFYSPKHTNLGEARNLAFEKSNGEWSCFLDCDDYWAINKLELQINALKKYSGNKVCSVVYGKTITKIENNLSNTFSSKILKDSKSIIRTGNIYYKMIFKNIIPLSSAIFSSKIFKKLGGVNPIYSFSEDYDLFLKLSKNHHVIGIDEPIAFYRVHENNLTHNKIHVGYLESIKILKSHMKHMPLAIFSIFINLCKLIISLTLNKIKK